MKVVAKVIAYVLIALLLAGGVGLIYKYTNGFNEDFKTMYVEYNGKQILASDTKLDVGCAQTHKFSVKYTFDNKKSEVKDYKVSILPHAEKDFDFTVDGKKVKFSKAENLDAAFRLKKEAAGFEITLPVRPSIALILEEAYKGKEVVVPEDADELNPSPFRLYVASYNDAVKYNLDLHWLASVITDIQLDTTHIIFSGNGVLKVEGKSDEETDQDTPARE